MVNELKNTDEEGQRRFNALLKASFIACSADILLILLKSVLAKITGSAVLTADAWHSGGDLAVSITVLLSIIINYRFKTNVWAQHAEGLVALLISFVLMFGSLKVITGVFTAETGRFLLKTGIPLVIAIAGISVAITIAFVMFRFKRKVGKEQNSIAFTAESFHTFSDFFTSFGVWLTLLLGYFGVHIERVMTFLVGLVILRIGFKLLIQALRFLNIRPKVSLNIEKLLPIKLSQGITAVFNYITGIFKNLFAFIKGIKFLQEEWILKNYRHIAVFAVLLIFILYLGTGFYSVQPYQTGLATIFGKVVQQAPPGYHYNFPQPFGKVIHVDTGVAARVESGFRTIYDFAGEEPEAYLWEFAHRQGRYVKVVDEAIAFTGDENLVDVNAICYYRITDPVKYAFDNFDSHELLRNIFCYEIHAVLGTYPLDELLSSGRGKIQEELLCNMKKAAEDMPLGVDVLKVILQDAHPPLEVVPQYRAVASARERKSEIIHQAHAYQNDLMPKTRGEAEAKMLAAEAYSAERLNTANGTAERFLLRAQNYRIHASVHQNRLRWDTVVKCFSNKSIIILPEEAKRRIFTSKTKQGIKGQ